MTRCDVLVVGGGPAGLAAATLLARARRRVIVVDREAELGGVPRHSHHIGFGMQDLRRVLTGPAYAARRVRLAREAGAELWPETTAIGWLDGRCVEITGPQGLGAIAARAIVLATGCRERPRAARLVPGDRPLGVYTTGSLQQLVYLERARPGRRALVVGAEHVSFSAVDTLLDAGVEVVGLVSPHSAHQTFAAYAWWTTGRRRIPVHLRHELAAIHGRRRVEAVTIRDLGRQSERRVACDTVVFTGEFRPEHELCRQGGLDIDAGTRGPAVDLQLRTSRPGVFAAGNLLRGAETADVAALEGIHAARGALELLADDSVPRRPRWIPVVAEAPLAWIAPSRIAPASALGPRARPFVFRTAQVVDDATVALRQGSRVLHRERFPRLVPNHWYRAPAELAALVTPEGGPLTLVLEADRGR